MQNSPSEKWRAKTGASFWQFQAKRGADLLFDSYLFVQFAIAFYFATGPILYPFTAPAVRPVINCRFASRYTIRIGISAMDAPAVMMCHSAAAFAE